LLKGQGFRLFYFGWKYATIKKMKNFSEKGEEAKASSSHFARLRFARVIEELQNKLLKLEDCL